MQAADCIFVIHHVPPELHNGLSLMMVNGLEIVVEVFLRLDEEFLLCRGRASGSTEGGMSFFVPYDQIMCMCYTKMLKAPVVQAWFPEPSPHEVPTLAAATPAPVEQAAPEEEAPEPAPAAGAARPGWVPGRPAAGVPGRLVTPAQPAAMPMSMPGMPMPAKAAMIERLRKRAQEGGPKPPDQK